MSKMGALWWLYEWLVWVAFSVFMMAIYPAFIAPLFNKFSPMQDGSSSSATRRCSPNAVFARAVCS
jgi:STE24 endopeptidase